MGLIARRWRGATALVLVGLGASIAAGSMASACALPGYSLGDTTTGSGGAGGATDGAGGKTTSVGSGGAGGQTTGGGGGQPCSAPGDCGPTLDPCEVFECNNNTCVRKALDGDLPSGGNLNPNGDCNKATCVGGNLKYQPDPSDTPVDKRPCTQDACVNESYIDHSPLPVGKDCKKDQSNTPGICDGSGRCVECLQPSAVCTSCVDGECLEGDGCSNNTKDPNETDVDCGGPCVPCPPGLKCITAADCKEGVCEGVTCVSPNYTDGAQNGLETDIDCGGSNPNRCGSGQGCLSDPDCKSGLCKKGACQFTCGNGVQDGAEKGVDCGGPGCPMLPCP